MDIRQLADRAKKAQDDVKKQGFSVTARRNRTLVAVATNGQDIIFLYDLFVSNESLRLATRKLFVDGHYVRAVEEAYKCVNHNVQIKSRSKLDGTALMQRVFSEKDPVLRFNDMKTVSDHNEQAGYMQILSGCVQGIRNPRAHDHMILDAPDTALELLIIANHLLKKIVSAERVKKSKRVTGY